MCVLVSIRIFGDFFLGVRTNSVGALSIRNGRNHLRISAKIWGFCAAFRLGILGLKGARRTPLEIEVARSALRPLADRFGTPLFRSDCAAQNFSIIITKKLSTRFYGIQGPVFCGRASIVKQRARVGTISIAQTTHLLV